MILGSIRDFSWFNEPDVVNFTDGGLQIIAQPQTDFWQNVDCDFYKDNGHFFASRRSNDFVFECKWRFDVLQDSAQCGAMVRIDALNWLKIGLLSPHINTPQIGVVVAHQGSSDWSMIDIPASVDFLWFKIKRKGQDFIMSYSFDGITYKSARMVHISTAKDILDVGAYACSPKNKTFPCVLEEISLNTL